MFLGINIFWALLRAHFNPRLTARAKMSLSRAQNIFMPANINSCFISPSVLGPNLRLPAHELISPNSFYETLNKGKLSPINYKHFSFWSGKQFR